MATFLHKYPLPLSATGQPTGHPCPCDPALANAERLCKDAKRNFEEAFESMPDAGEPATAWLGKWESEVAIDC